ncbi:MAG: GNAT family N-acetyltransferase [Clostridia bacterium]|nr:GNAT family N-acetyltransferase [Clostridia bacterium]
MSILKTERLILRPWSPTDLDDLYEYSKDARVGSMAGWKPHISKDEAIKALDQYITQEYHWAIVLATENKVVGAIKLNPDNNRGKYHAKAISFVLSPNYWGQGIMTEAAKIVIQYAFDELNIDLLSAFHYSENYRSKRVIEKCGFEYEITLPKSSQRYDGQLFDTVCYCILKSKYYKHS